MTPASKTNPPRWRTLRRFAQLFAGLSLYGVSMALLVESGLGLDPWDVFHQGVAEATGMSFGWVVILTGVPIMLLWIPLRQRPGFGTIANLIVIGLVVDGALAVLPTAHLLAARIAYLVGGVVLNGLATGLYLGTRLGPGPRDGLMTGLVARFPRLSVRLVRTGIEVSVLGAGWLLGGTVGVGTVLYALAIGPLVQLFLPLCAVPGVGDPPRPTLEGHPDDEPPATSASRGRHRHGIIAAWRLGAGTGTMHGSSSLRSSPSGSSATGLCTPPCP